MVEPLLMTMSDIAALAGVKRPVVSVWRTRAASTSTPFPAPVTRQRGQDIFEAAQIASWLRETRRGKNPEAHIDVAAYAAPGPRETPGENFPAVSALLLLRSIVGDPLSVLSVGDLLDAADENDPDDEVLYREVEGAGESLGDLARYVDELTEAAFGEAAAFERVSVRQQSDDTALSPLAVELLARVAIALLASLPSDPVIIDVTNSVGDVLIALAKDEFTSRDLTIRTTGDDSEEGRLMRRRLAIHGIQWETVDMQADGSFAVAGNAVHVAQFPLARNVGMGAEEILSAIEQIVLQMDDDQLAIVMAPSSVLSDADLERTADLIRSALLRSGRVRAIARLPVGLHPRKPRQAQTIWVLGDAQASVDIAQRWTMVTDLSAVRLDQVAIDDLAGDFVASLGNIATVRAHAFRFARLVLTRTLISTRDSLVAGTRHTAKPTAKGPALAVRFDELLGALRSNSETEGFDRLAVEPAIPDGSATTATVERLISGRHLTYVAGNRLEPVDIVENGPAGASFEVIGPAEVAGESPLGHRRIDRLLFAVKYSAGRLTEPGDVVFCTSPRPAAIVDTEGSSVVAFPVRILRIDPSDPNGLLSEVLAADIAAVPAAHKQWRSWPVRQSDHRQRGALTDALASIRLGQEQARARLARLDELSSLLMSGITAGSLTLSFASDLPAPPEGTI